MKQKNKCTVFAFAALALVMMGSVSGVESKEKTVGEQAAPSPYQMTPQETSQWSDLGKVKAQWDALDEQQRKQALKGYLGSIGLGDFAQWDGEVFASIYANKINQPLQGITTKTLKNLILKSTTPNLIQKTLAKFQPEINPACMEQFRNVIGIL
jgi:hypothetical protein